jgi:hypothetical protein
MAVFDKRSMRHCCESSHLASGVVAVACGRSQEAVLGRAVKYH